MAGLVVPMLVTATLQQGLVFDPRHGLALDGLLASAIRAKRAQGAPGSLLDGGLGPLDPKTWELPLAACTRAESLWHWLATSGLPVDRNGDPVPLIPDPHRLFQALDERRAPQVAISQPQHAGGARGRFRQRVTPVLAIPAAKVLWRAVGDPETVRNLLQDLPSIGARRGSGEGAVLAWSVEEAPIDDPDAFAHEHPDGTQGRPLPEACVLSLGRRSQETGPAGLRPPLFHPANQHLLVIASEREPQHATT